MAYQDEIFVDVEAAEEGFVRGREELEVALVGVGLQGHVGDALVGRVAVPVEEGFALVHDLELEVALQGEREGALGGTLGGVGVVVGGPEEEASLAGLGQAAAGVQLPHAHRALVSGIAFQPHLESSR